MSNIFIQVLYCFLMYVEFGIGEWLEKRVLLYALTHQVRTRLWQKVLYMMVGRDRTDGRAG